jgi:hypothetical protein
MQEVNRRTTLRLAETARVDADLTVSKVSDSVTAAAPSVLETPQVSTNFDAKTIESLPVDRTIQGRVLLAPGVINTGPNFGKATNKDAYQLPCTYRFAVGVRF